MYWIGLNENFYPNARSSSNCFCSINPMHCLCTQNNETYIDDNSSRWSWSGGETGETGEDDNHPVGFVWGYCILGNINDQMTT